MLVFFALGNAKLPDASSFVSQWKLALFFLLIHLGNIRAVTYVLYDTVIFISLDPADRCNSWDIAKLIF